MGVKSNPPTQIFLPYQTILYNIYFVSVSLDFVNWKCYNRYMKTPLNYTGNKSRLIEQLKAHIPEKNDVFVDLFCGGGSVGLSMNAKKIFLIDNNKYVIELSKHLSNFKFETLLNRLEKIIDKYNLTYTSKFGYGKYKKEEKDNNGYKIFNEKGFYQMRKDFNNQKNKFSKKSLDLLYMLLVYGFNNDLRFNAKGEYNLPAGKTDLNKMNIQKLKDFIKVKKEKNIEFIHGSFKDKKIKEIIFESDFLYMDPHYLITNAVYNENSGWNEFEEKKLLNLLSELNKKNKKFILSDVLSTNKKINSLLSNFIKIKREILTI